MDIRRNRITGVVIMDIELDDRQELTSRYLSEAPFGGLLVDCDQDCLEEEALVELNIHLLNTREIHRLRGVVLWCRRAAATPCVGIGFLPIDTMRREQLLCCSGAEDQERCSKEDLLRLSSREDASRWKVSYQSSTEIYIQLIDKAFEEALERI